MMISREDDHQLAARVSRGEEAALRRLIDRYDRLVRYTVFRTARTSCLHDPSFLDSTASQTWMGFVQSCRRGGENIPDSISAYLVRIARNQTISALRSQFAQSESVHSVDEMRARSDDAHAHSATDFWSEMESLSSLNDCFEELEEADRILISQLQAIMERKWSEAAAGLGMSESTLRSRWVKCLERLRRCMKAKSGENFAPKPAMGDQFHDGISW